MQISILSPDKIIFTGDINSVKVPGVNGSFEVLSNHAPIVSSLVTGVVKITKSDGEVFQFAIEKGFIEVLKNNVSLLVEGYKEQVSA